jgi:hypothetical protein
MRPKPKKPIGFMYSARPVISEDNAETAKWAQAAKSTVTTSASRPRLMYLNSIFFTTIHYRLNRV